MKQSLCIGSGIRSWAVLLGVSMTRTAFGHPGHGPSECSAFHWLWDPNHAGLPIAILLAVAVFIAHRMRTATKTASADV